MGIVIAFFFPWLNLSKAEFHIFQESYRPTRVRVHAFPSDATPRYLIRYCSRVYLNIPENHRSYLSFSSTVFRIIRVHIDSFQFFYLIYSIFWQGSGGTWWLQEWSLRFLLGPSGILTYWLLHYRRKHMLIQFVYSAIFDDTKTPVHEPVVQCVQVKPLPPQPGHQERYRAVFSDISNYVQTMLATRKWKGYGHRQSELGSLPTDRMFTLAEANHLVTSGSLRKGCFARLKSFQANSVKGKKSVAWNFVPEYSLTPTGS